MGVMVKLDRVYKDCSLHVGHQKLPTDLIVMTMKEFDIIFGIDLLTKCHTNLDCVGKSITFSMPKSVPFHF